MAGTTDKDAIRGMWAALPTPLTAAGAVDAPTLVAHAKGLQQAGCNGFVLFGTTGEGTSFSATERLAATEAMLAAGFAPGELALGTGFPALPDTVALMRDALALGLTHCLMLPPYFYRDAPVEGVEDAFAEAIDAVGDGRLRLTLYNIPQTSGVAVPPAVAKRLKARFGVVLAGLKDSSGIWESFLSYRQAVPELAVTVGNESDIGRAVAAGGAGTICGMVNITPGLVSAMFTDPGADVTMKRAQGLMDGGFIPIMKSVLAAQTGHAGWAATRAPLRPADAATGQSVAAALQELATRHAA